MEIKRHQPSNRKRTDLKNHSRNQPTISTLQHKPLDKTPGSKTEREGTQVNIWDNPTHDKQY
jgi:hypothetical protein